MTGSRPTGARRPVARGHQLAHHGPRLRIGFGVLVVVLVLLAGRLVQLQGLDGASYAARAEQQRRQSRTLPADRGAIVDRNGVPLAMSVDTRTIFVDPHDAQDDAIRTAEAVAPLLGMTETDVLDRIARPGRYVVLKRDVAPSTARAILAKRLAGVGAEPDTRRVYPAGDLAANLLGIQPNGEPRSGAGLEMAKDSVLAGTPGRLVAELGAGGREIPAGEHAERAPVPGSSVQLTIDRDLQWAAQSALAAQVKAVRADSGTAIVMDPRTGELLAMATAPTFDPNRPAAGVPVSNPAVGDVYEPGSVNKVITVAGALQERAVTPTTPFTVPDKLRAVGHTFHDAETHKTERLTVTGILAKSSNVGTIKVSQRMTRGTFYRYLRGFGFGQRSGVGFPGESRGILPPPSTWSASQRYTLAFGQGVSVTALQVASVYATIANGGVRVAPTLVRATIGPDGTPKRAAAPAARRVVSAAVAKQVRDMLEAATTDEGTAPKARIAGYRVAGKTGTAQRPNPRCGCYAGGGYTASFVGFAPADKPQLLVEVVLQNPRKGHYGGTVSAPVFHQIMSFALKSLRIPPTGTAPPDASLIAPPVGRPPVRRPG